ncbi:MAG TPA: hypothetical protein VIC87_18700 [Vicinamibacteria bacterium]
MPNEVSESPFTQRAECPYCEHRVLVYEEPPRCPLCACPFETRRVDPGAWPGTPIGG